MTPTDPVKELIEAAEKATPGKWMATKELANVLTDDLSVAHFVVARAYGREPLADAVFIAAARNAIPSLSAMVAREEAVREYIKELRAHPDSIYRPLWAAERLEQIFPKGGA